MSKKSLRPEQYVLDSIEELVNDQLAVGPVDDYNDSLKSDTHTYQVNVTREDGWWMVEVPELDGYVDADGAVNTSTLTQARHRGEVEAMARDFICTVTGKAPSDVRLTIIARA